MDINCKSNPFQSGNMFEAREPSETTQNDHNLKFGMFSEDADKPKVSIFANNRKTFSFI